MTSSPNFDVRFGYRHKQTPPSVYNAKARDDIDAVPRFCVMVKE